MAEVIRMPKMSDTMEEGVIASWLKKEGDQVNSGDILAEVETDKATMELESYHDGVLLHIGVKEEESVPVNGMIAVIGEKGEDYQHLLNDPEQQAGATEEIEEESAAQPLTNTGPAEIDAKIIRMPKMSDTMKEGVIASWHKKAGDLIRSGDILAEVETDKATMELEAYEDGTLLHIAAEGGSSVPVDGIIAIIGEKDADYQALLDAEVKSATTETGGDDPVPEETPKPKKTTSNTAAPEAPFVPVSGNGRILASPLAKKIATEKGIDLSRVQGTGDGGRIIKRDVEDFKPVAMPVTIPDAKTGTGEQAFTFPMVRGEERTERIALTQVRKVIARRLSESKFSAPHFYLTMEINMDNAIMARKSMNEISPVKISFNDIVVKAAAAALRKHPGINVSWKGDHVIRKHHIHIGVAVAIPEGLVVPVVKFADAKSLAHISAEVKTLSQKAKDKKLLPDDFSGSTFTVSNLGMFGIEEFTAVINPPEACIMAVGTIKETVMIKDGEMRPGHVMKVTVSCDHRLVDGAIGADFLKTFKEMMENPIRMLL